jgi:hypothetical protein
MTNQAAESSVMSEETLDTWIDEEIQHFMRTADEGRFRKVLREEARQLQHGEQLLRSYTEQGDDAPGTMVIAFGGLQQRMGGGGGGGGMPPYEFVRSCQKAGARHALFVRDPTRCWYCRGLGDGGGGHGASSSFEQMVEVLRAEVARVRPRRLVTIGSSMGVPRNGSSRAVCTSHDTYTCGVIRCDVV